MVKIVRIVVRGDDRDLSIESYLAVYEVTMRTMLRLGLLVHEQNILRNENKI